MVADVRDPAITVPVDERLIGASSLQVVIADQLHVVLFNLWAPRLRGRAGVDHDTQRSETQRRESQL